MRAAATISVTNPYGSDTAAVVWCVSVYSPPNLPPEQTLFQVFWCEQCQHYGHGLFRFVDFTVAPAKQLRQADCYVGEAREVEVECYLIKDWQKELDYPHYEDYMTTGVRVPNGVSAMTFNIRDHRYNAKSCDKLSGFPAWNNACARTCAVSACHCQMELIFQFGHRGACHPLFTLGTVLHIMQCPTHKNSMTYDWNAD